MYLSLLHVNIGSNPDRPQPGRLWLNNIYHVHQRLWMAYPDDERRAADPFFLGKWDDSSYTEPKPKRRDMGFLFRIERDGLPRILIQSAQKPDWEYAFQNAPYLLANTPQVRQYEPAPRKDHTYRFRLMANIVRRKSVAHSSGRTRTTRAGITVMRKRRAEINIHPSPVPDRLPADPVEREQILRDRWNPWREWLRHIGEERGFRVVDEQKTPLTMEAVRVHVQRHDKNKNSEHNNGSIDRQYNAGLFEGVLVCTDADRLGQAMINGIGNGKAFGFGLLSVAEMR